MAAAAARLQTVSEHSARGESADFRVVVRVRPALADEHAAAGSHDSLVCDGTMVTARHDDGLGPSPAYSFTFDAAFSPADGQDEVYDRAARPAVGSILAGFNASIIAYGHTGAGKTFTMDGALEPPEARGIIPRAIHGIFSHIAQEALAAPSKRFLVRAGYLQVSTDHTRTHTHTHQEDVARMVS